jgi:hypothetical protein
VSQFGVLHLVTRHLYDIAIATAGAGSVQRLGRHGRRRLSSLGQGKRGEGGAWSCCRDVFVPAALVQADKTINGRLFVLWKVLEIP